MIFICENIHLSQYQEKTDTTASTCFYFVRATLNSTSKYAGFCIGGGFLKAYIDHKCAYVILFVWITEN